MGSTNWGHQRKAVALIKTLPRAKSSRRDKKSFFFVYGNDHKPGHMMTISVPASVNNTLAIAYVPA
ncbi:hypothetical protein EHN07_07425 [Buttiauxella warmboldiae]|uniref:Uncharacterized protein n=1 Tax=Buttiauxella warmboldiae TaxID=82993 RepID=A0A3N5E1Z6_9ENTR|nr:hypothetical protein EHN07_07425 [Buttiauxella warmboldiae]